MFKRITIAFSLLCPAWTLSANSFLASAIVQSQVDAGGLGADACQYAGVSVVRNGYPNQVAIQVGGSVPSDPSRIFTRPGIGSYFLTDVGSQWTSSVSQGQVLLAVLETLPGLHTWTGAAYAGAGQGTLTKPNVVAGRLELNGVLMTRLPSPLLLQATLSSVYLRIPAAAEPSGLGTGLRVWRQRADFPSDPWQVVADIPWSVAAPQDLTDTVVVANEAYIYGVSFIYAWPGGSGAGADPSSNGFYITSAKGISDRIVVNPVQPTPTPFPTLVVANATPNLGQDPWIAYPNPLVGSSLHLAFKTEKDDAKYSLVVHSLAGDKVLELRGEAGSAGWQKPLVDLNKLSAGIYLVRLTVSEPESAEKIWPVRKLAIIK
jgi:hypothetical protein